MKVKLYTTVTVKETRMKGAQNVPGASTILYDSVSQQTIALLPLSKEEQIEELLGTFEGRLQSSPDGSRQWIIVNTPRKRIRINPETLTKKTDVNTFRIEIID
jgi:hypothetical protein